MALIVIYLCSLAVDILINNEVVEWDRVYLIENTLIAFAISLLHPSFLDWSIVVMALSIRHF